MPNTCAAYGCNNKFGPETKLKGVTFHLLPAPTDFRRKLWIGNSRRIDPLTRKPWNPTSKYVYFCSDHFMPSDFENAGKPFGRRLKDTAVPTVFTFPTVATPSQVGQSNIGDAGETPTAQPTEESGRPNVFARSRKSKHRKVVMLPKKIKLLQENSTSDVESVTIISFQHLDYDEKMQPMFEEAMLDLQYPEESEPEHEDEYYDDQYTELQSAVPLEEEPVLTPRVEIQEQAASNLEAADSREVPAEGTTNVSVERTEAAGETSVSENTDVNGNSRWSNTNQTVATEERGEVMIDNTEIEIVEETEPEIQQNVRNVSCPELLKPVQRDQRTVVVKKRIPVVMKEISVIDDIEELRVKAFRIAEDNIKLKKQVIYLEERLEELIAEKYVK